jgi:cytochrome c-type biogenesis protein CcmH/NrfF
MPINEDARHFAKAMIEAGREPSFVFEVMVAYYGELVGREAALAAIEEYESRES